MAHPAKEFLQSLDSSTDACFSIEVYTDAPKGCSKPKPDPLTRQFRDQSVEEVVACLPKLQVLNGKGAGIFVAVNAFKGRRKKPNIARVRGVHADLDDVDEETLASLRSVLPPTLEVQTSGPRNWHFYWLLADGEELAADEAEAINRGLVGFGADPAAVDITRLLRLPGFAHMKQRTKGCATSGSEVTKPEPVVALISSGQRYSSAQLVEAFPNKTKRSDHRNRRDAVQLQTDGGVAVAKIRLRYAENIRREVEQQKNSYPKVWAGGWKDLTDGLTRKPLYPSQSEADYDLARTIALHLTADGVPEANLPIVVEAVFELSGLAKRKKWKNRPDYRRLTLAKACAGLPAKPAQRAGRTVEVNWSLKTDLRNSCFFADINRGHFIFVQDRGLWLRWREERWQVCNKGEEIEAAKEVSVKLLTEAGKVAARDPENGNKIVREVAEAHKEPRLTAMLKLARSEPGMSVTTKELDADKTLLGVKNGIVDLKTGELSKNRPDRLVTRYCTTGYLRGKPAPMWKRFLSDIFEDDTETIDAVQRLLGLTVTGLNREELLIFSVGSGANGKSIFSNVVSAILGDYGVTAPSSLLASRRADDAGPRSDLAMLAGARLVSINELPGGMTLDETIAKQLAGREPITARFLHREFFTFEPSFTPWVRTNHRPIIKGADEGIWRRICVIRFGRTFGPEEADPQLEEKLRAEHTGILNWMVEGARKYLATGLTLSPAMKREVKQYRSASDMLGEFLAEETEAGDEHEEIQSDLFRRWKHWCDDNCYHAGAKGTFTERLLERGYETRKSGAKRYYLGIKCRGRRCT